MDTLQEQAIACIARSNLSHFADSLVDLLRPSICVLPRSLSEQDLEIGASKIGGTPDLPLNVAWPEYQGVPLPFYAQIRCTDLAPSDSEGSLPHEGVLYFFYDVNAAFYAAHQDPWARRRKKTSPPPGSWRVLSEAGLVPYPHECWRVLYWAGELSQLRQTIFPPSLAEYLRYTCCPVTFVPEIMLPGYGSARLGHLGLSYGTFEAEEDLAHYQELEEQLHRLSGSALMHGIRLLGYPDDSDDEREQACEEYSRALGWHTLQSTERNSDSEWILLLQIDCNRFDVHGGTNMDQADGLVIYFWIRRDALLRLHFDHVWALSYAY